MPGAKPTPRATHSAAAAQLPLVNSVTFTYSGTAAPMCAWSWLGARRYVIRLENATTCSWWHSLSYSFRYVVPQFHLPTISSIYVIIIHLHGQPNSETPCSLSRGNHF